MLVTYRIGKNLRSIRVHSEYYIYFYTITAISLSLAVITGMLMAKIDVVNYIYLFIKTASIVVNIVLFTMLC